MGASLAMSWIPLLAVFIAAGAVCGWIDRRLGGGLLVIMLGVSLAAVATLLALAGAGFAISAAEAVVAGLALLVGFAATAFLHRATRDESGPSPPGYVFRGERLGNPTGLAKARLAATATSGDDKPAPIAESASSAAVMPRHEGSPDPVLPLTTPSRESDTPAAARSVEAGVVGAAPPAAPLPAPPAAPLPAPPAAPVPVAHAAPAPAPAAHPEPIEPRQAAEPEPRGHEALPPPTSPQSTTIEPPTQGALFADHEATAVSDSAPHPTGIRVAASPPESPFVTTAADAPGPPVQAVTPDLVIEAHQPISLADPPAAPAVPDEARHPGERPPGLLAARSGRADDLKWIKGIGPLNESRLNALGIWHFEQIATWSPDNVRWIGSYLAFHGRIDREHWIDQAKALMAGAPPAPKRSGPKGAAAPRP